jgi:3-(3-hydroxy-phenyl)propionate hydroxylase
MCSGLRDADNLAWKLGAVIRRGADPALLDSYQTEREPHVRDLIQVAIAMGRVVCIADPQAAAMRDAGMLALRAAGGEPPAPAPSKLGPGVSLEGGGEYFPQPWAGDARMDDVLGEGPWLITREAVADGALSPFADRLAPWFESRGVEAVLVRPDRYVFGMGEASVLEAAWVERVG